MRTGEIVPIEDRGAFVLLARVTGVAALPRNERGQVEAPATARYSATVVCEYRSKVPAGASIRVRGLIGSQGSWPANVPEMNKGDLFVMLVRKTGENEFENIGDSRLPIGLWAPRVVDPEDAEALAGGLRSLGKAVEEGGGRLSRDEAARLMGGDNYFLWALGVSAMASEGDRAAKETLERQFAREGLSARQVLWLDELLRSGTTGGVRAGAEELHGLLVVYLKTIAARDEGRKSRAATRPD